MKTFFKNYIAPVGVTIILTLIFTTFVAKVIVVQGDSMNPNYHNGEVGFSWVYHDFMEIERNDVASIKVSNDENYKIIIKRIIGLPGEVIECKNNQIFVNGELLEQDYLAPDAYTSDFFVILEDDEYFALGDNRANSKDSRHYGTFTRDDFVTIGTLMLP